MRVSKKEYEEALANLRQWIKPGDTVYTILDSVSRSGMSRTIRVVMPYTDQSRCDCHTYPETAPHFVGTPRIDFIHPNWAVGRVLGLRHGRHNGREADGLVMSGCGMDMGFALVNDLSYKLYPEYACLGKGPDGRCICPSSYHTNHRDMIRCEGTRVHNPHGTDFGSPCYRPGSFFSRREAPAGWPRRIIEVEGEQIEAGPLSCIVYEADDAIPTGAEVIALEDGSRVQVCPVCKGVGELPNPEGPERFDLVHTDGYALRHKWL